MFGVTVQILDIAALVGHLQGASFQVAVHVVVRDARLDQGLGLLGKLPQQNGVVRAHQLFQGHLILALPGAQLAAVAARGAPADLLGLQQQNVIVALGEVQRCGQSRQAAAHDADVAHAVSL